MYAIEIDHHRGGRCYAVNGSGITTTDIQRAMHRSVPGCLEEVAWQRFKGLNPKIVEVPPKNRKA